MLHAATTGLHKERRTQSYAEAISGKFKTKLNNESVLAMDVSDVYYDRNDER
jgi:hypothetical protein